MSSCERCVNMGRLNSGLAGKIYKHSVNLRAMKSQLRHSSQSMVCGSTNPNGILGNYTTIFQRYQIQSRPNDHEKASPGANGTLPAPSLESGAIEISYFSSHGALSSSLRGVNFTVKPSLTANTLSLSRYSVSLSKIWVVIDL
jgi:hypothetical protein